MAWEKQPRKQASPAEGRRTTVAGEQDRQALRTKQARSGASSWGRARSPFLGVPPGSVGAGGKAASQSGLLGEHPAEHLRGGDGQGRGCERKGDLAPPAHRGMRACLAAPCGAPGQDQPAHFSPAWGEEMIPKAWLLLRKYFRSSPQSLRNTKKTHLHQKKFIHGHDLSQLRQSQLH